MNEVEDFATDIWPWMYQMIVDFDEQYKLHYYCYRPENLVENNEILKNAVLDCARRLLIGYYEALEVPRPFTPDQATALAALLIARKALVCDFDEPFYNADALEAYGCKSNARNLRSLREKELAVLLTNKFKVYSGTAMADKNKQFIDRYLKERDLLAKDIEHVEAENQRLEQHINAMALQMEREHFENIEPLTTRVNRRMQVVRNVQQRAQEQLAQQLKKAKSEQEHTRMLEEFKRLYFPDDKLSALVNQTSTTSAVANPVEK